MYKRRKAKNYNLAPCNTLFPQLSTEELKRINKSLEAEIQQVEEQLTDLEQEVAQLHQDFNQWKKEQGHMGVMAEVKRRDGLEEMGLY